MSELFLYLFNNSITAAYLVLAILVFRVLLGKAPKYIRYILWGLVGIRLLIPISIESVCSLIPSREVISQDIVYQEKPMVHVGIESVDNLVNPILTENFAASPEESVNPIQMVTEIASYVWFLGMILLLGYTVFSYINLKKKVWDATRLQDNVFQSERITSPFVLGIFKPVIYVPYGLSEIERECVLTHEKIHIRRKDYLIKPLAFLLLTVYWFQPLLWIAYILLCKDIELSCDEKAIAKLGESAKRDYSETLLNLCISNHAITACPIAFGETSVKARIKNVINYKKPTVWMLLISVIGIVAVAVCFMTSPEKENAVNTEVSVEEEEPIGEEIRVTNDNETTEASSAETEETSLPRIPLKQQLREEILNTLGIPVEFTPNDDWIAILSYQCSDDSAKVQYRDDVLGSTCEFQIVQDRKLNLPEWEFDSNLDENWEGYTKSSQYVAIKVQVTADEKNALVTWEYEGYQFAIQAALPEDGKELVSTLPKTAIYMIQNLE